MMPAARLAVLVQKHVRGAQGRKRGRRHMRRTKRRRAARIIQTAWRGYSARKLTRRALVSRRERRVRRRAAQKVRKFMHHAWGELRRRANERSRALHLSFLHAQARTVQRWWRETWTLVLVVRLKRQLAATRLAAAWRGYFERNLGWTFWERKRLAEVKSNTCTKK